MTITVEKAFKLYMACRLHFLHNYDIFDSKCRFKNQEKVHTRQDLFLVKGLIAIAPEPKDFIDLCVANYLYGNDNFLYGDSYTEENYKRYKRTKESLTYTLQQDVNRILDEIDMQDKTLREYAATYLISDLLSRKIQPESVIIIQRYIPILDMIEGYNAEAFRKRMHKANKFVVGGRTYDLHRDIVNQLKGK